MNSRAFSFLAALCCVFVLSCQKKSPKEASGQQQITVIDKKSMITEVVGKDVQLVDVRTAEEFEAGHIDDAVNYNIIDSKTFSNQIKGLDKEKPVYLYCKMGGRSNRAASLLIKKGFKQVYDYTGGYNDWISN